MRLTIFTATACVLTVTALAIQRGRQSTDAAAATGAEVKRANEPAGAPAPLAGKLIVHEWGTFTSFSGSDGIHLEFRPLVDEDLPAFVLDRFLQSGVPNIWAKSQIRVRMRMETPVTYFYTDRERDVEVKVAFPEGLLTEFYPPVERMQPEFKLNEQPPTKNSLLDWGRIHLIPTDRLQAQVDDPELRRVLESRMAAGLLPHADTNNHYLQARETDSAIVEVRRSDPGPTQLRPQGAFFEKFLFYRGVGNFDLPLKLSSTSDGRFELVNSGADPIHSLFLVDIADKQVRFSQVDQIPANSRLVLTQSTESTTTDNLGSAMVAALVGHGLYEKEARAMVNTWKSSWFGEQGTRLLYAVPQSITDKLLPLSISPSPDQTVRVLIGRMEIMTPEAEAHVTQLVRSSAAERESTMRQAQQSGAPFQFAWSTDLKRLGRLVEPALVRVSKVSQDPTVRAEARMLLKTLDQRQ